MTNHVDEVARVVREEIVRQYRDDERGKCPAGVNYYEEHISPEHIAEAAMRAIVKQMRERTSPNSMFDEYMLRRLDTYVKEAGIDD